MMHDIGKKIFEELHSQTTDNEQERLPVSSRSCNLS